MNITNRIKGRLAFIRSYLYLIFLLTIKKPISSSFVRVRVSKIENTLLLTTVVQYLLEAGHQVALVPTFKTLANSTALANNTALSRYWAADPRVVLDAWPWRRQLPDFTISDTNPSDIQLVEGGYEIWRKTGRFPQNAFPLGVHPRCAFGNKTTKKQYLRSNPRTKLISFSGNTNPISYDNQALEVAFGISSRTSLVQDVRDAMEKLDPEKKQWDFRDWKWTSPRDPTPRDRIYDDKWLQFLAENKFFLCAPGITGPMCHNALEAMSIGTVPVLEYNTQFSPPLEHKVNCFKIDRTVDPLVWLADLLSISDSEWHDMSKRVTSYYDQHIEPNGFFKKINRTSPNAEPLMLYYHSDYEAQKFSNKHANIITRAPRLT